MTAAVEETIRVPCALRSVSRVREGIRELAARHGLDREMTDDLVLAVNEAATNAIRYGCPTGGDIEIIWRGDDECIRVEVRDTGVFRKRLPLAGLELDHGRGIPLMLALCNELHIQEGTPRRPGTVVRLVKCGGR